MRSSGWHSRKLRSTDHSPRNGADPRRGANLINIVSPEFSGSIPLGGGRDGGMMARRAVVGLLAGAVSAMALGSCGSSNSASYRFRMTVEVETPQGLKTGSSVMEVRLTRGVAIGDSSGVGSSVQGEAVVVDLPDGPLFVLLEVPDAGPPLQAIVPDALLGRRSSGPNEVMADTAKLGSTWFSEYKADLPRHRDNGFEQSDNGWPMMVRFGNINDPKSVRKVDPDAIGVTRISLETTGDDVTTGIEKRLGWLHNEGQPLDTNGGPSFSPTPPFAQTLYQRMFSTEIGK